MLMQPNREAAGLDFIQVRALSNGASEGGGPESCRPHHLRAQPQFVTQTLAGRGMESSQSHPFPPAPPATTLGPHLSVLSSPLSHCLTPTCIIRILCTICPILSTHPTCPFSPPFMHQNMEYKFVELLSCRFQASPEDVVRQQVSAQRLGGI